MIRVAEENQIENILEAIGKNYGECLYLYLDLIKYRLNNNNIKIWVNDNNSKIDTVILQYYSGMHVYSTAKSIRVQEIIEIIKNQKPTAIFAKKSIIDQLCDEDYFKGSQIEYGWIRKLDHIDECEQSEIIKKPSKKDFEDIAKLLISDPDIGGTYTYETLHDQITKRQKEGYGRNYILKDGEKVISHAGTGAENKTLGILNYVITDSNYRRKGLAAKLCQAICYDLIKEGKTVFLVNYSYESTKLYDKLGFIVYCNWGKIVIKK